MARQVQEGRIAYDEKIATYWPEFAQGGKENVLVKELMGHRAGIAWLDADQQIPMEEMQNLDKVAELVAKQPHNYDGVTKQAYHASTRGLAANEIVRRTDPEKRTMGAVLQEWICKPLGVEAYFGLPEELEEKVTSFTDYPFKVS